MHCRDVGFAFDGLNYKLIHHTKSYKFCLFSLNSITQFFNLETASTLNKISRVPGNIISNKEFHIIVCFFFTLEKNIVEIMKSKDFHLIEQLLRRKLFILIIGT